MRERTGTAATVRHGLLAGVAGTLAMDLVWFRRYRRSGGGEGFADWELATSTTGFEGAAAPAQVGKRLYEVVLRRPINSAHLVFGSTCAAALWLLGARGSMRRRPA